MRKAILVAVVVLLAAVAVTAAQTYTLAPWPYGVVAWVPTEPDSAVIQRAEKAVQGVFSFWHQQLPQSASNWDKLRQMDGEVWAESNYDPFTAGFVPIPSQSASVMWAIPLPTWNGDKILPLTLIALPSPTLLESLVSSTAGAAFSPSSMRDNVLSLNQDPALAMLMRRSDAILFNYNGPVLSYALNHELSHWLMSLICQTNSLSLQDVPPLLGEGFAEYTAFRLGGENRFWRISAAVWAEDGHSLSDVSKFMLYPIGTSLVSFLVERDGIDAFIENFPKLVANWDQVVSDISPTWQAWVLKYKVDEAERAYAEATIEQLPLCKIVLEPILPYEALSILRRLGSLSGTMQDIERFWQLVSAPIPRPSSDVWKELQKQTHTIVQVASADSDSAIVKTAEENEYQLSRLWAKGDWDGYHDLLIKTLREVVAHYGTKQEETVPAMENN